MKITNTVSKSLVALAALVAIGAGAGLTAIASAASTTDQNGTTTTTPPWGAHKMGMMGRDHGVRGTVSGINGSTMTITNTDGTSYTVDASSAKVSKIVDLTVGDIKVGDTVGVMGDVSGTSVTAKHIMDGIPPTPQAPPSDN